MLSLKDGKPVAIIKGGEYDGKLVYVKSKYDDEGNLNTTDEEDLPFDYTSLLQHDVFRRMGKRERMDEYDRVYRMMKRKKKPRRKDKLYDEVKKIKQNSTLTALKLGREGKMMPIPDPDREATNLYIAGPNGSGKSYFLGQWMRAYRKIFPKNKIYVFKRSQRRDPAFKGIKFEDVDHDDFVTDPYELDELRNSLLVFDDTSRIRDKKVCEGFKNLLMDALENGRKIHISVAVSNHLVADANRTKTQLYESDYLVVFPGSSDAQITYVAKTYVGMGYKAISKMLELPSRWILMNKSRPQHVIYIKGIYLL